MYAGQRAAGNVRFINKTVSVSAKLKALSVLVLVLLSGALAGRVIAWASPCEKTLDTAAKMSVCSLVPSASAVLEKDEGGFAEWMLLQLTGVDVADGGVINTLTLLSVAKKGEKEVIEEDMGEKVEEIIEPTFAPIPENKLPILDVNTSKGAVKGYYSTCGVYMNNQTSHTPDLDKLLKSPLPFTIDARGPQVLIISTHSTEGYSERTGNWYDENDPARTQNTEKNVIRVGAEVAEVLNNNGIYTLHETGLNDYPSYNGSYTRTLEVIEWYLDKYPTIKTVIDVHRDSMVRADGTALRPVADINGERVAQIMIVAGTDEGGLSNPDWEYNLAYAVKITDAMNKRYPTLARPINLRKERFNMHLTKGSLIAEVGTNSNTLEEAVRAGGYLGECIAQVLKNG